MHSPSARVTVERGIADVEVYRENVIVEVRDYDAKPGTGNGRDLWKGKDGRECRRYFVPSNGQRTIASDCASELEKFASDLGSLPKMSVSFERDESPDGLHVLSINEVDFYFYADGAGYDGWGKQIDLQYRRDCPGYRYQYLERLCPHRRRRSMRRKRILRLGPPRNL